MNELERIQSVLVAMRRRTLLRAALQTAGFGLAAMLVALLALSLSASAVGPAGFWPLLSVVVLAALGLGALVVGLLRPARRLRGDRAAAGLVSRLYPPIASDLVSAVELGSPDVMPETADTEAGAVSRTLVRALQGSVAGSVEPLDPRRLISLQPAMLALAVLLLVAAATITALQLSPDLIRGLATLFHRPTRFEGAAISAAPIVGDLRITYEYPAYTGLPPRIVEGSTGDIIAVKGTQGAARDAPAAPHAQGAAAAGRERRARRAAGEAGAQACCRPS